MFGLALRVFGGEELTYVSTLLLDDILRFTRSIAPLKESPAQTRAPSAALFEAAKKEGEVVFYTPLNINDSRPLLQRFEQRYPFIKTELLRLSAEPLLNRIFTEDGLDETSST